MLDIINLIFYLKVNKRFMRIYVDIDETICETPENRDYALSVPIRENIEKANKLYDEGWEVIYWTARGSISKTDYYQFTWDQLKSWGCKFHDLCTGTGGKHQKPAYDLVIDDKAKRIEELEGPNEKTREG